MTTQTQPETQLDSELPVESEAAVAEAEPTIDYKAKFEASEAARIQVEADRGKIANDLASLKGLRMTEVQREQLLGEIAERLEVMDRQQTALIKALGENTTEELPAEVAKIQAEGQQAREGRGFAAQYNSIWQDLEAAVKDPQGDIVLDLYNAPELKEVRRIWNSTKDANNNMTMSALEVLAVSAKAVAEANRVTKSELRKRDQAESKKVKEEAQATVRREREESGALDLDTGPAAGGGNLSNDTFLQRYADGDLSSPADHARAKKILASL